MSQVNFLARLLKYCSRGDYKLVLKRSLEDKDYKFLTFFDEMEPFEYSKVFRSSSGKSNYIPWKNKIRINGEVMFEDER
jgi:hypothetical protein